MAIIVAVGLAPAMALAAPLFPHPGGTHPPGFVVHLPPIGPVLLPPGGLVGPFPYGDGMPNPADPHHFEVELNNPLGSPLFAYDVAITVPILGLVFLGNITLPPGNSVYWDIHYPDMPEVGGAYTFFATNPPAGPPTWTIDASVIEYNFPIAGPGPVGPLFAGAGGAFAGPAVGGIPLAITVIPEPSSLAIAALGVVGMLVMQRRRR